MDDKKRKMVVMIPSELFEKLDKYEHEAFDRHFSHYNIEELESADTKELARAFFYHGYLLGTTDAARYEELHDAANQIKEQVDVQLHAEEKD